MVTKKQNKVELIVIGNEGKWDANPTPPAEKATAPAKPKPVKPILPPKRQNDPIIAKRTSVATTVQPPPVTAQKKAAHYLVGEKLLSSPSAAVNAPLPAGYWNHVAAYEAKDRSPKSALVRDAVDLYRDPEIDTDVVLSVDRWSQFMASSVNEILALEQELLHMIHSRSSFDSLRPQGGSAGRGEPSELSMLSTSRHYLFPPRGKGGAATTWFSADNAQARVPEPSNSWAHERRSVFSTLAALRGDVVSLGRLIVDVAAAAAESGQRRHERAVAGLGAAADLQFGLADLQKIAQISDKTAGAVGSLREQLKLSMASLRGQEAQLMNETLAALRRAQMHGLLWEEEELEESGSSLNGEESNEVEEVFQVEADVQRDIDALVEEGLQDLEESDALLTSFVSEISSASKEDIEIEGTGPSSESNSNSRADEELEIEPECVNVSMHSVVHRGPRIIKETDAVENVLFRSCLSLVHLEAELSAISRFHAALNGSPAMKWTPQHSSNGVFAATGAGNARGSSESVRAPGWSAEDNAAFYGTLNERLSQLGRPRAFQSREQALRLFVDGRMPLLTAEYVTVAKVSRSRFSEHGDDFTPSELQMVELTSLVETSAVPHALQDRSTDELLEHILGSDQMEGEALLALPVDDLGRLFCGLLPNPEPLSTSPESKLVHDDALSALTNVSKKLQGKSPSKYRFSQTFDSLEALAGFVHVPGVFSDEEALETARVLSARIPFLDEAHALRLVERVDTQHRARVLVALLQFHNRRVRAAHAKATAKAASIVESSSSTHAPAPESILVQLPQVLPAEARVDVEFEFDESDDEPTAAHVHSEGDLQQRVREAERQLQATQVRLWRQQKQLARQEAEAALERAARQERNARRAKEAQERQALREKVEAWRMQQAQLALASSSARGTAGNRKGIQVKSTRSRSHSYEDSVDGSALAVARAKGGIAAVEERRRQRERASEALTSKLKLKSGEFGQNLKGMVPLKSALDSGKGKVGENTVQTPLGPYVPLEGEAEIEKPTAAWETHAKTTRLLEKARKATITAHAHATPVASVVQRSGGRGYTFGTPAALPSRAIPAWRKSLGR